MACVRKKVRLDDQNAPDNPQMDHNALDMQYSLYLDQAEFSDTEAIEQWFKSKKR